MASNEPGRERNSIRRSDASDGLPRFEAETAASLTEFWNSQPDIQAENIWAKIEAEIQPRPPWWRAAFGRSMAMPVGSPGLRYAVVAVAAAIVLMFLTILAIEPLQGAPEPGETPEDSFVAVSDGPETVSNSVPLESGDNGSGENLAPDSSGPVAESLPLTPIAPRSTDPATDGAGSTNDSDNREPHFVEGPDDAASADDDLVILAESTVPTGQQSGDGDHGPTPESTAVTEVHVVETGEAGVVDPGTETEEVEDSALEVSPTVGPIDDSSGASDPIDPPVTPGPSETPEPGDDIEPT